MVLDFQNFNLEKISPQSAVEIQVVDFIKLWLSDEKLISVKTSGSTGIPKIIQVEKEKMRNSAALTCDFLNLKEGNSALLCLPIDYISGKMMVVRAIERQMQLYVGDTNLQPLKDFSGKIDFCAMTPLQVENSLDTIPEIRKLIIGGAKVSALLKQKIRQVLKNANSSTEVYETYGMSETLSHIALREILPSEDEIFTVFQGIKIATDERNCLQISAPMLNSEVLQTNDLVEIVNENQFKFLGRADFIINSGGLKISPEELENIVKSKISNELVFIGLPDEKLGQKLVLVVESPESGELLDKIKQINFPSKNHFPKEIVFLEKFPRSENGKVLRLQILEFLKDR